MTTLEIILAFITTLSGSGNVVLLLTWRSLKRQKKSEADQAQIQTLNQIIDTWSQQFNSLQARYDKLQEKYEMLMEKYDEQQQQIVELRKTK